MKGRRWVIGLLGVLLLAVAGELAPKPPARASTLSALGQSMGGLRVLLVDFLFLRAEHLQQAGREDELPALYTAVRDLDPGNTTAVDFLAGVYAYDLLSDAPDADSRFGWWRAAWDLVESSLQNHPREPSLLMRSSDLLLEVAAADPELDARVRRRIGDPALMGLERLAAAARVTSTLPRRGRTHLERLAFLVPAVAVTQEERAGREAILALGDEVLELRGATLDEMLYVPAGGGEGVPTSRVLAEGLRLVRAVSSAAEQSDVEGARRAIASYRSRVPDTGLAALLERVLAGGGR